jgi:hypothetical protein
MTTSTAAIDVAAAAAAATARATIAAAAAAASTPAVTTATVATGTLFPALADRPKMGGVKGDQTAEAVAWTGGKPKVDWSGLQNPAKPMFSPHCVRCAKASEQVKSYSLRIAEPKKLFSTGDDTYDLDTYTKIVLKHMETTGMDTIMYVASVTDPTVMVNVISHNDEVTLKHVVTETAKNYPLFDAFDVENDRAARTFLEASIGTSLFQELGLRQLESDGAATTWMRILHLACDGSVERYNRQKNELKLLSPLKEPGESILLYSNKVRKICRSLDQAKHFEWMLILGIVKTLGTCSVETFRTIWHPKRMALDTLLSQSAFMTPPVAAAFMTSEGYHYTQILELAELSYRSLFENGEWGPANSVKDVQQAPGAFFASMDQVSFNALVQSQVDKRMHQATENKDTKNVCYTCGGTGHNKNQCPNNNPNGNSPSGGAPHWRSVPPKSGEPTTITVAGRILNFCTKCKAGKGFWTGTHETSTHGAKPAANATIVPPAPNVNLAQVGDGLGIYQF